ncbi:hypothetical protein FRX31_014140 [Thalictrum thalictroides]|uniref:Uncharacterized protein n=1 Tax=Thalictrum thalictroides TaxID=46969 RepID=A0A7J6WFQ6_THATH|nr:hypothetical protein FRX31_014140 [Thalictrum thalictroides]
MSNELSLSNTANVDENVITEQEDRSDQEEDDLTVSSNVELTFSVPCSDGDEVEDQAGPSNVPDDGDDIEASTSRRLREAAMRLMRKERKKNQGKIVTPEGDCVVRRIRVK